ncbi:hypothetical protein AMTR_s00001p00188360 [Amborella trichopoda]|uniref:alpha-galactosidase n=1 Tax=Amborella trichopoda TaxID=13333 RepID=W1NM23_AMBTC|nr:hypothetical protein AMTR_s00001p00188360 [Amborella trichopoda]
MKGPLLIGYDVRTKDEVTYGIPTNKEIIVVNQDKLGIQGHKVMRVGDFEVWVGPLSYSRVDVLMLNKGNTTTNITTNYIDVGLNLFKPVYVRDLWKHNYLPSIYRGSLTAEVKPHDCRVFVLA